jgi:two-component system, chemotaxis family, CheB/CheR fusion protein
MDDATPPSRPIHENLTALRRQVVDLQAAQEVAHQIVATVRDPLLVLTPDCRVQSTNPAFYQLFHVTPAETEGQSLYALDNGQWNLPELRTLLEDILPQNTVFNDYAVTHDFARIGPRTILLNARRLEHLDLILLALEDITARRQDEARLEQLVQERTAALVHEMAERQRLEREAQRSQHFALLGRLAAGVSHEIRNPLGALVLQVDLLEEALRDPAPESAAEIPQTLTEIRTNLGRLDELVQDYLSLVRVGVAQLIPADLGTLVTHWAQELAPALAVHRVTLQLDAVDQLGQVALHANTFRRVLVNLVDNARDAMPQGGTVTLRGRRQGATVQLDVEDTGIGIPPEQYRQIFEPLHTTKPEGTGLGLYIVQEVMAAHGGQVVVQSTVGAGTTFTLTLPVAGAGETL